MRVFAYMRYSSLNQKGNTSVETQREAITRFVETLPELRGSQIVERIDEAKSGTTVNNRHALKLIMQEAARGDAVVVFKYDRLGRNLLDSLQTLRELENSGVQVFSTSEPNTEVVRNLLLTMAQEFSRQLGERCKRALDARAQAGHAANKPAFGYRIERAEKNGPGKFVPVPESAAIVRSIFEARSRGETLYSIVEALNNKNVPSPRGTLWRVATVRVILRNETYLGRVASGMRKFKKGEGLKGIRPRNEWVVCENAHEPIISWELWSKVRDFDCEKGKTNIPSPKRRSPHLWSGFVTCKHCGANLIRNQVSAAYLGCDGGRKLGRKLPCGCRYLVREEVLSKAVFAVIHERLYSESKIKDLKKQIRASIEKMAGNVAPEIADLEAHCKKLTQQMESASRRLVHVSDDLQSSFLEELQKLRVERENTKAKIEKLSAITSKIPNAELICQKIDERLAALNELDFNKDTAKSREQLMLHVEKIEIATDGQAWLYPTAHGILADSPEAVQGFGNIPTGI